MNKILFLLALLFLTACASHAPSSSAPNVDRHDTMVPKDLYNKVLPAIYEVVVPKPEEKGVVYEKPLPLDRLPFRMRNDKYLSIGTAFAVGENEFVSAAHVFPIYMKTFASEFYLRDQDGHVYPVDQILRYSVYRDLISFSVKDAPSKHATLVFSKQPEIGDTVFVIGNAQGEGISLRSGQISSFTPEEVENKWKFIRFSAPASPGNSGGPLLNEKGEVAGIVTRKNLSENLNYAIPADEIGQLSTKQAEFIIRNEKFTRDSVVEEKTWQFELPLPEKLSRVAELAEASLYQASKKSLMALYAPKDERFFPANKQFQEYARHQHTQNGIGELLAPKTGSEWQTLFYKLHTTKLAENEFVEWNANKSNYVFYVSKPKGTGLYEFSTSPKLIFEQAAKGLGLERPYLGEKIKILSLGEPDEKGQWKDDVGRTWSEGFWIISSNNIFVEMNCAPTPRGAVCMMSLMPKEALSLAVRTLLKKTVNTMLWSYLATVDEWKEFLNADKAILPDCFKDSSIQLSDGKLKAQFGDKYLASSGELSGKSEVTIRTHYTPEINPKIEVSSIALRPDKDKEIFFSQHWIWKPMDKAPEKALDFWKNVKNAKLKFDGRIHKDGRWNEVYLTSKSDTRLGIPRLTYVHCSDGPDVADKKLPDHCRDFLKINKAM